MSLNTDFDTIATCYDVSNIFTSRWEFSWLTKEVPPSHLESLKMLTDEINSWTKEYLMLDREEGVPRLYPYPWTWIPIRGVNAYGAKIDFGARPDDPVMQYLRKLRPISMQYPSSFYVLCKCEEEVDLSSGDNRGIDSTSKDEFGITSLKYDRLPTEPKEMKTSLRHDLEEMASRGVKVYKALKEEMHHVKDKGEA